MFRITKQYVDSIADYADKALLLDPELAQSLIAKAFSYMVVGENSKAVPYLEKALEYNPNSAIVINILADFYSRYDPNTEKYLELALKGVLLDIASYDSITASYIYLHLGNALIQTGFVEKANKYIDKSLEYNPNNLYSLTVKAYTEYAQDYNLKKAEKQLLETYAKDTNRLDVLQEVAKIFYFERDFEKSFYYYKKFLDAKKAASLDIYWSEDLNIAYVYNQVGLKVESDSLRRAYKLRADQNQSIYKDLTISMYYASIGDEQNAIKHLKLFSTQDDYFYWLLLFLEIDPTVDKLKKNKEFILLLDNLETKFWRKHELLKDKFERKGLM